MAWRRKRKQKRLNVSFPLYCKIHGVKTTDRQGALAQTRSGDKLQVVHIPLPDYPYNVYVYSVDLNRVLGYLHPELSKKLVQAFGENFCRNAIVENTTGGVTTKPNIGCNICIFDKMTYINETFDVNVLRGE